MARKKKSEEEKTLSKTGKAKQQTKKASNQKTLNKSKPGKDSEVTPTVTPKEEKKSDKAVKSTNDAFPIVGIGASAGGLEAFEQFFTNMPSDSGMAFVLVQHLDPHRKSLLSELIGRQTSMKTVEAEDGMKVEPNCVYTIPPNRNIAISDHNLLLLEMATEHAQRTPIDFFFRSLAEDQTVHAVGIVLSGSGSEGALGLRAIKAEGGVTFVQDPETARYDSMPRSAIKSGSVDFILPPDEMPEQLLGLAKGLRATEIKTKPDVSDSEQGTLTKIFILIRSQTGLDFSYYKESTILRRIERRMVVNQIEHMTDYLRYLQKDPKEIQDLFNDLLIGVTSFFRDPEAFEALDQKVIPLLFKQREEEGLIRCWVPGCATGEEAYSLAILFKEHLEKKDRPFRVQIFGTDIDEQAIEKARAGVYPSSIAADIPPRLLKHHFIEQDHGWIVKKDIRESVVFAVQNVVADPPFSKMDLVSCRNLLIYMKLELQKNVLPYFHYALKNDGFLFLGTSETIGDSVSLFDVVDTKAKIFKRRPGSKPSLGELHIPAEAVHYEGPGRIAKRIRQQQYKRPSSLGMVAQRALLENYDVAGVLLDHNRNAVYFNGPTDRYLKTPSGSASWNIVDLAREGMEGMINSSVSRVARLRKAVRTRRVKVKRNGETYRVDIVVKPITDVEGMEDWLLVAFEGGLNPELPQDQQSSTSVREKDRPEIGRLRQELNETRERLQATIEELETSNEELKSSNEELQSSNEELQSTNEELGTAKEEQQSVNEELSTVNAELQQKVRELSTAQNDMANLLASTQIGTIFLDNTLKIQRFTPAAKTLVPLIDADVGRPFKDINHNLNHDSLYKDAQKVLDTLNSKQLELSDSSGKWYLTHIRPYRTAENVIEGVVITFVDITDNYYMRETLEESRNFLNNIVETVREPLVVLDERMKVLSANRAFYRTFRVSGEVTVGTLFYDLGNRQWDIPELRNMLEQVLPEKKEIEDYKVEHEFERIGRKKILVNARTMEGNNEKPGFILIAMKDVTDSE